MRTKPRRVVVIAYDGLATFEFGIAVEVFGLRRSIGAPWYDFKVAAVRRGPVRARGGITVTANSGLGALRRADVVVVPGWCSVDEPPPGDLLRALRSAHRRGARVVGICTGAFVLAAAGLLDGRAATTHWLYAGRLAERFPEVRVDPGVLFVDEDPVFTSAGSAAGIDLCLHIVRKDYGAEVANLVARRMVTPPLREGSQAQYIVAAAAPLEPEGLGTLLEWMQSNLSSQLSVPRLARRAHMSPRTFARRFKDVTGTTPHRWVTHQRLVAAQRLLETTRRSMDEIAQAVGLQTAVTLRHHFGASLRTSPTAYRRRFAIPAA